MTWFALIVSVVSLATALVAVWQAYGARRAAGQAQRRARVAEDRAVALYARVAVAEGAPAAGPGGDQLITAALDDAANLSRACHAVLQALDEGREPPTAAGYARVQRCSELFTGSVGEMRAPHDGELVRELTDELVTLHHSLVTEVRQH